MWDQARLIYFQIEYYAEINELVIIGYFEERTPSRIQIMTIGIMELSKLTTGRRMN